MPGAPIKSHSEEVEKWDQYYASLSLSEPVETHQAFHDEFVQIVSSLLADGGKILEAGCGGGLQSLALARSGRFQVSLLDFSKEALKYAHRLFEQEQLSADFICEDVFLSRKPEFDLVFNAGVLEHYSFEEQVSYLRGMASRSRKYIIVLVPNRLCYWYWLWRLQKSSQGEWPFGKEVPLADLSAAFGAAELHFLGQTFLGADWTEYFISNFPGIDAALRNDIVKIHRSPIIPETEKCYLVAALGSVSEGVVEIPGIWTIPSLAEETQIAEMSAALADALAIRLGAERDLSLLRPRVKELDAEVAELNARVTEKQKALQTLSDQLANREQAVHRLSAQVETQSRALESIYRSEHWKLLQVFWGARSTALRFVRHPYQTFRQYLRAVIPIEWRRRTLFTVRRWLPMLNKKDVRFAPVVDSITPIENARPISSGTYDVICFANIDWAARYQRPQQIMRQFANRGHRVFYVVASHFVALNDRQGFEAVPVAHNVFEVSLRGVRAINFYGETMTEENKKLFFSSLEQLKREFHIGSAVSVVHLAFWTPLVLDLRERWGWLINYDCMDEWVDFPNIGQAILDEEERLVRESDVVTVTAALLEEKWSAVSKQCLLVRNGADFEFFASHCRPNGLLKEIEHPVIGYYGALAEWVDFDLLRFLAIQRPNWNFVLIGDVFVQDLSGLEMLPNVHLLGRRPYGEMPLYLYHFDVCLIPFRLNDVTQAVDPVKFYEFISVGKPVVAVPLSELMVYEQYLYLTDTPNGFLERIELALAENDLDLTKKRVALAKQNEWQDRYKSIHQAIVGVYSRASIVVVTYQNVELTQECVESILRNTTWPNYEIIVVDNNSQDATKNYLRYLDRNYENVKIILNDENKGFAAANNQGLRVAEGDYLVLLNNDTVVTKGWLNSLIRHLKDPDVGLVGPVTNFVGNEARIDVSYQTLEEMESYAEVYTQQHEGQVFDISMLAMFCVAMRRDAFEQVGFLDEGFKTGMFEDDDYSHRMREKGYRLICARDTFVHHYGQAAFRQLLRTGEYQAIWDENQAYFESKWGAKQQSVSQSQLEGITET